MASHRVAIAKATFAASLLRPDPSNPPLTRDDAAHFDGLLNAAIIRCSPANIQACREWLCQNILVSSARVSALAKFLSSLSDSYKSNEKYSAQDGHVSSKRMRLHLLYIVNDSMHWTKFHDAGIDLDSISSQLLVVVTKVLCTSARRDKNASQRRLLSDLLSVWHDSRYFSVKDTTELQSAFEVACEDNEETEATPAGTAQSAVTKELPWTMPSTHGDPLTPYYDLPAANMMSLITPNSSEPIDTHRMKALKLSEGPADPGLIAIVQDFLQSAEKIYNSNEDTDTEAHDIDAMGQEIITDELGDRVSGETYYGWSRTFCEKIQRRLSDTGPNGARRGRAASRSDSDYSRRSSQSRSRSRTPRKRRRSSSESRSRSRSRVRRRSNYSSSRSRSRSRTDARVRSRSRSPRRQGNITSQRPFAQPIPQMPVAQNLQRHPLPLPLPGMPLPPGILPMGLPVPPPPIGLSHNGMPLPPPKPIGWQGAWPPPPPPLPSGSAFNLPFPPGNSNHPSMSVPPPPPPPGHWQAQPRPDNSGIDRSRDPRRR